MKYAYLFGSLLYMVVWLIFFLLRPDLRKKMLVISIYTLPLGLFSEIFGFKDTWFPQTISNYHIEGMIYGFALGGIGTTIYQVIFRKSFSDKKTSKHLFLLVSVTISTALWLLVSYYLLKFNSMYAANLALFIIGVIFVSVRKDLIMPSILGAISFLVLTIILYQIILIFDPNIFRTFWDLKNVWQPLIFRIPVQELLWALVWGFVATPAYDLTFGLQYNGKKE